MKNGSEKCHRRPWSGRLVIVVGCSISPEGTLDTKKNNPQNRTTQYNFTGV